MRGPSSLHHQFDLHARGALRPRSADLGLVFAASTHLVGAQMAAAATRVRACPEYAAGEKGAFQLDRRQTIATH